MQEANARSEKLSDQTEQALLARRVAHSLRNVAQVLTVQELHLRRHSYHSSADRILRCIREVVANAQQLEQQYDKDLDGILSSSFLGLPPL